MADITTLRICSADPTHDISEAAPWSVICPQCGANLINAPQPPPEPPGESNPAKPSPQFDPPGPFPPEPQPIDPTSSTELWPDIDPPHYPAPALICARVPSHDLSKAPERAVFCPQAGCGGRLIQLECAKDLSHDVARRPAGSFVCPVCRSDLLTPYCKSEPDHSMVQRPAGGASCPLDGAPVERRRYVPPPPGTRPPVDPPPIDPPPIDPPVIDPQVGPWWRRYWRYLTGGLALIVIVSAAGFGLRKGGAPVNPCAAVPKDPLEALHLATAQLNAGMPAGQARVLGELNLKCNATEAAIPFLVHAAKAKDTAAARTLGELSDPSFEWALRARPELKANAAAVYYAQAANAHDVTVRPDLERLVAWLKAHPADAYAAALPGAVAALEQLK